MNLYTKYLQTHIDCKEAIQAFKNIKSNMSEPNVDVWAQKYKSLSERISFGTKGFPKIADANIDGIHFTYISQFHHLYNNRHRYFTDLSRETISFLEV